MDNNDYVYELYQVDAWADIEGWTYNDVFKLGTYHTSAKDHKAAFLSQLHKRGIVSKKGTCSVHYDGTFYELCNRQTGEPLFAARLIEY